jgi:hypothetical protein
MERELIERHGFAESLRRQPLPLQSARARYLSSCHYGLRRPGAFLLR